MATSSVVRLFSDFRVHARKLDQDVRDLRAVMNSAPADLVGNEELSSEVLRNITNKVTKIEKECEGLEVAVCTGASFQQLLDAALGVLRQNQAMVQDVENRLREKGTELSAYVPKGLNVASLAMAIAAPSEAEQQKGAGEAPSTPQVLQSFFKGRSQLQAADAPEAKGGASAAPAAAAAHTPPCDRGYSDPKTPNLDDYGLSDYAAITPPAPAIEAAAPSAARTARSGRRPAGVSRTPPMPQLCTPRLTLGVGALGSPGPRTRFLQARGTPPPRVRPTPRRPDATPKTPGFAPLDTSGVSSADGSAFKPPALDRSLGLASKYNEEADRTFYTAADDSFTEGAPAAAPPAIRPVGQAEYAAAPAHIRTQMSFELLAKAVDRVNAGLASGRLRAGLAEDGASSAPALSQELIAEGTGMDNGPALRTLLTMLKTLGRLRILRRGLYALC